MWVGMASSVGLVGVRVRQGGVQGPCRLDPPLGVVGGAHRLLVLGRLLRSASSCWCERDTMTPPTIATSSSSEMASKG